MKPAPDWPPGSTLSADATPVGSAGQKLASEGGSGTFVSPPLPGRKSAGRCGVDGGDKITLTAGVRTGGVPNVAVGLLAL
jgi:hypothetical protein